MMAVMMGVWLLQLVVVVFSAATVAPDDDDRDEGLSLSSLS